MRRPLPMRPGLLAAQESLRPGHVPRQGHLMLRPATYERGHPLSICGTHLAPLHPDILFLPLLGAHSLLTTQHQAAAPGGTSPAGLNLAPGALSSATPGP